MILMTALINAPLVAVDPYSPHVYHAVTIEGLPIGEWEDAEWCESACGLTQVKLMGPEDRGVPWPPAVAGLGVGAKRCLECHRLTGRKRPRSRFVAVAS